MAHPVPNHTDHIIIPQPDVASLVVDAPDIVPVATMTSTLPTIHEGLA